MRWVLQTILGLSEERLSPAEAKDFASAWTSSILQGKICAAVADARLTGKKSAQIEINPLSFPDGSHMGPITENVAKALAANIDAEYGISARAVRVGVHYGLDIPLAQFTGDHEGHEDQEDAPNTEAQVEGAARSQAEGAVA